MSSGWDAGERARERSRDGVDSRVVGGSVTASDGSTTDAGAVVIAAGAHSAALARACGDPVPLDTERGYHVQWAPTPASAPPVLTRPVCTPEGGFIVTPMSGGVRAAGLVELGVPPRDPSPRGSSNSRRSRGRCCGTKRR